MEKIVHVHVTMPILQIGGGSRDEAQANIRRAIATTGERRTRTVEFDTRGPNKARFSISRKQIDVIARFMKYNPRKLERFCLLFDLKWKSRFPSNSRAFLASSAIRDQAALQSWLDDFRDRLIWEAIVELRWPTYDAKTGDLAANRASIQRAIEGLQPQARGLPCEGFVEDSEFVEIHRVRNEWRASKAAP